jgi:hypothetical protein
MIKPSFNSVQSLGDGKVTMLPILYNGELINCVRSIYYFDDINKKMFRELYLEGKEPGILCKIWNLKSMRRKNFGIKYYYSIISKDETSSEMLIPFGLTLHKKLINFDLTDIKTTKNLIIKSKKIGGFDAYDESVVYVENKPINNKISDMTEFIDDHFKLDKYRIRELFPDEYSEVINNIRNNKLNDILDECGN